MQEVIYAVLPSIPASELLPKVNLIGNYIVNEKPNMRALKRFFREHDAYDKERFEIFLKFLGINYAGKVIKVGEFLETLLKFIDPEDQKRHLFKHLMLKNEILMKYVMDGIAERLYSTNELYRYLTSYVYPGAFITLVDFRNWMAWLEASEHIRVIGIRWGLSDLGKDSIDKLIKFIDIDDILDGNLDDDYDDDDDDEDSEDEEDSDDEDSEDEEDSDDEDSEDEDKDKISIAATTTVEAATDEVKAESVSNKAVSESKPKAMRRQAQSTLAKAAAAAAAADNATAAPLPVANIGETRHVSVVVQPIAPKTDETPLQLVRAAFETADKEEAENDEGEMGSAPSVRIEQFRLDEAMVADNLRAVRVWWQQRPGGKILTASDYGFSADSFATTPAYGLFRLTALALQLFRYQGRLNTSRGGQSFAMLEQMGFYDNLMHSEISVDEIIAALLDGGLGNRLEEFSNLHYLLSIRRSLLKLRDEGVAEILKNESLGDLVMNLWAHLGQYHLTYEILWIARELVALGVANAKDGQTLGVIPLPKVRETAFRLGFIETPYASDFAHLVSISRRLSSFFTANDAWEAPLVYFEPKRDLRYDSSEPAYFTRDQLGMD